MPPGGLALGVIPTGVRLFFFYFLNPRGVFSFLSVFFLGKIQKRTWTRRFELGTGFTTASVCLSRRFFFIFLFWQMTVESAAGVSVWGLCPGGASGLSGVYILYLDSTQQECLSRCDVLSFLAVSKHTHTEAQQRALTNSRIRGCVRQARARSLPNSSTHMFTAVCPGRRGGGVD